MKWLALALVLASGCGKSKDKAAPPPPPLTSGADLPDPHTVDWANLTYDVGSLGTVKATNGRAVFRVREDDTGFHATQGSVATADWPGFLDVDLPAYVDLDGDGHDEALIPFELESAQLDDTPHVFGVFVFTLRDGVPVRLGTITTSSNPGYTLVGPAIKTTEGVTWTWDPARKALVTAP
jgi:hypothetical protein